MSDQKYIYAFVHIPKTAGTTFRYHIEKYLPARERLYLGAEILGLWNEKRGANFEDCKKAVLRKLKEHANLEKVKIIYGHEVIYGIHKYLPKPVRYFAFFRDPIIRTISMYNNYREQYEELCGINSEDEDYKELLLVRGKIPSFEDWLVEKYNPTGKMNYFTIYQRLILNGFVKDEKNKIKAINKALDKFWFTGDISNFDSESLYLYNKIGINAFFVNQNISRKYFDLNNNMKIKKKIIAKNKNDLKIFKEVLKRNEIFKKMHSDFEPIVRRMEIKKRMLLPFTQTIYAPRDAYRIFFKKLGI